MDKLKSCPFCGTEGSPFSFDPEYHFTLCTGPHLINLGGMWQVVCGKCQSSSGLYKTMDEAEISWNERKEIRNLGRKNPVEEVK